MVIECLSLGAVGYIYINHCNGMYRSAPTDLWSPIYAENFTEKKMEGHAFTHYVQLRSGKACTGELCSTLTTRGPTLDVII